MNIKLRFFIPVFVLIILCFNLTACTKEQSTEMSTVENIHDNSWQVESLSEQTEKYCAIGECLQLLYEMTGKPDVMPIETTFTGSACEQYPDALCWAYAHNLTSGCPDTIYNADEYITYNEFATILYTYIFHDIPGEVYYGRFSEKEVKQIPSWALTAMEYLVYEKVLDVDCLKLGKTKSAPVYVLQHDMVAILDRVKESMDKLRNRGTFVIFHGNPLDVQNYYYIDSEDQDTISSLLKDSSFQTIQKVTQNVEYTVFDDGLEYQLSISDNGMIQYLCLEHYGLGNTVAKVCTDPTISEELLGILELLTFDAIIPEYYEASIGIMPFQDRSVNVPLALLRENSTHYVRYSTQEYSWEILSDYETYKRLVIEAMNYSEGDLAYLDEWNGEYSMVEPGFFNENNMLAVLVGDYENWRYLPLLTDIQIQDDDTVEVRVVVHYKSMCTACGTGAIFMLPVSKDIKDVKIKIVVSETVEDLVFDFNVVY